MLIAAESLDIGACWNGFVSVIFSGQNADEYKKLLSIPEGYLGYKDSGVTKAPARAENTVHYIR